MEDTKVLKKRFNIKKLKGKEIVKKYEQLSQKKLAEKQALTENTWLKTSVIE